MQVIKVIYGEGGLGMSNTKCLKHQQQYNNTTIQQCNRFKGNNQQRFQGSKLWFTTPTILSRRLQHCDKSVTELQI